MWGSDVDFDFLNIKILVKFNQNQIGNTFRKTLGVYYPN